MLNIPYRTQRTMKRVSIVLMVLLVLAVCAWLCWVIWLQRYVVYVASEDGASAMLDFSMSANEAMGEEGVKPEAQQNISIFYNEGANAIDTSKDLKQLDGYYITSDMFKQNMDDVLLQIERLKAGTAVMIEMKGSFGSFYYPSKLGGATISASTDVQAVANLVKKLQDKGFYTIAQVSAFRDREFGDKNVTCGLYMLSRAGLWMDPDGMYWLDPTNASTTSWISSVVVELRDMGFNEVLLSNFFFPGSEQYIFNGDKPAALKAAADTIISTCAADNFVVSFESTDPAFALPDGRCRLYLRNVDPNNIDQTLKLATFDDTTERLVFLSETGDTRFDTHSILRTLDVAEEVEGRRLG